MSDVTDGAANQGRASAASGVMWDEFERRLAIALGRMAVDQYFIISIRPAGDDESLYYVQFTQGGRAGFLAEAVSNNFLMGAKQLTPAQEEAMGELGWQFPHPRATKDLNFSREWPMPAPFGDVARLAVMTLRDIYRVEYPNDLVYRRFARGGHDFAEPSLGIDAERPTTPRGKGQPVAPTAAELTPLLEATLGQFLGVPTVPPDANGIYRVPVGTSTLLVRVLPTAPPIVRVFAPVLSGLSPTPELLEAINQANAELVFGRVMLVNREVIVAVEVRSDGITADDVAHACLFVGATVAQIQERLGGRIAGTPTTPETTRRPN